MAAARQQIIASEFTSSHAHSVAELAVPLGVVLQLDPVTLEALKVGATIHDIGKIGVPSELLDKNGALTPDEYAIVQRHTVLGAEVARACDLPKGAVEIIRSHHEWWDGSGYPDGLKGANIPLLARIVAIADAYEAMTSNRPYRNGQSARYAITELLRGAGTQFDPHLVKAFVTQVLSVT